jgi:hypothetical protein
MAVEYEKAYSRIRVPFVDIVHCGGNLPFRLFGFQFTIRRKATGTQFQGFCGCRGVSASLLSSSEKATSSPRAATPPRHVAVATKGKQRYHVTGREDRHAPPNRVTRHHRHGLHAPRPSRRARRGALRGDPGLCRSHQTTKSCKSGTFLEV